MDWEARFERFLSETIAGPDVAHDVEHTRRVVRNAKVLAYAEGATLAVVVPAAWLHDCVTVPKASEQRPRASKLAAVTARRFLEQEGYTPSLIPAIEHAIHAHSFSAGISPQTREAQVVQDADRLDALGAIGLARAFMLGGSAGQHLYHPAEPIPQGRDPDDGSYVIDHFFAKLLDLAGSMQTGSGRREAEARTAFLRAYLEQLHEEIVWGHPAR